MGEGAGVTTAGERLRALSGLSSATAAQHLLAISLGTGGAHPVFGQRFAVVTHELADWVVDLQARTYLFVEEPVERFRFALMSRQCVTATSRGGDSTVASPDGAIFVAPREGAVFLRSGAERATAFTRAS